LTDQICPIRCDDGTLPADSALLKWSELLLEATQKVGRGFDSALFYGDQLKKAGYVDIKLEVARWPMNQWPKDKKMKEIGIWQRENLLSGASGISIALFTRILGWTPEEVEVVRSHNSSVHENTTNHDQVPRKREKGYEGYQDPFLLGLVSLKSFVRGE
jgi:hypothetical protein